MFRVLVLSLGLAGCANLEETRADNIQGCEVWFSNSKVLPIDEIVNQKYLQTYTFKSLINYRERIDQFTYSINCGESGKVDLIAEAFKANGLESETVEYKGRYFIQAK